MVADPASAEGAAFAQALSALKERGSNLLVVGATVGGAHCEACDRLLGETDGNPRRRLQVRTDGECGVGPDTVDDVRRILTGEPNKRSTAVQSGSDGWSPQATASGDDLGELGTTVLEEIEAIEAEAGGLSPAELRVCVDSLLPLLAGADEERTFRLLTVLTRRVRTVDGMAHFHLPVAPEDRYVDLLEPLFDAVISVRACDGRAEHHWHLVDEDVSSGWLPL